jgi:hypothetical protein
MTDEEIKEYVDMRIKVALKARAPAISSPNFGPQSELSELDVKVRAMCELLRGRFPEFEEDYLDKACTEIKRKEALDADEAAGGLLGEENH